ncbi:hypothetical protein [Sorangium sp. So ce887]|uniref:hypothetical protein n=1 Tax=Sorangium sp. So ce887 TaxID=3133324 RepID=UPI003F61D1BB
MVDLFDLIVAESKAHPAFLALRNSPNHSGARLLMNGLYDRMGDPNGNFCSDFQSEGFHSRMFELACFAYIEEMGALIDREHEAPDFLISVDGSRVAIEAATANPVSRQTTDISLRSLEDLSHDALSDKVLNEFPVKMGRLLIGKRQKRYWALPHCRDVPFVIIVSPLFEAGSTSFTDDVLSRYLYGIEEYTGWVERNGLWVRSVPVDRHSYNGRSVRSNFFCQVDSEHISAVIYANSFTVPKFLRIAIESGLETSTSAQRAGTAYVFSPGDRCELVDFEYDVGDSHMSREAWSQGVTVFFNPRARVPLPHDLLPCTSSVRLEHGSIVRELYGFHPLASVTRAGDVVGYGSPMETAG